MAPPLHATAVVLAAACMLAVVVDSSAEPPAAYSAPLNPSDALYTMQFCIGGTEASGTVDTGSDLIWTNNTLLLDSIVSCSSEKGKEMEMGCCSNVATFDRKYGRDVHVRGVLGEGTLTFGAGQSSHSTPPPTNKIGSAVMEEGHLTFEAAGQCSHSTAPQPIQIGSAVMFGCHSPEANTKRACKAYKRGGIVGLGRGEMSLVRQLGLHSFSYCLPHPDPDPDPSRKMTGQIKFYKTAASLEGPIEKTKLVKPEGLSYPASSGYYLKLKNIFYPTSQVAVALKNDCLQDKGGLMFIDSGTSFSHLPSEAFDSVRNEVKKLLKKNKGEEPKEILDRGFICYEGKYPDGIKDRMVLHFCDGAQMEIPSENYLYKQTDTSFCLAFKEQPQDGEQMSILGAYQQRGMHMLFDIQNNDLSFTKHSVCGQSFAI